MPKYNSITNSFQYGELTPVFAARTDTEQYQKGAQKIENMIVLPSGGVRRRPGSVYVFGSQLESSVTGGAAGIVGARLVEFIFSKTEAYALLFSIDQPTNSLKMSAWKPTSAQGGAVAATIQALTIDGTWSQAQLNEMQWVQKGDVLFLTQKDHPPFVVVRTAANTFTIEHYLNYDQGKPIETGWNVLNRPFRDANITSRTLKNSATTGTGITLTAGPTTAITGAASNGGPNLIRITSVAHGHLTGDSVVITGVTGTVEANGQWTITRIAANTFDLQGSVFVNAWIANGTVFPAFFDSLMDSQSTIAENATYFKINEGANTGVVRITGITDAAHATADVVVGFAGTVENDDWAESAWSWYRGWPACCSIFESRLVIGNNEDTPDQLWGSLVNNFFHFMQTRLQQDATTDVSGLNFFGTGGLETDPFTFTPAAKEINTIEWIQSGRTLVIGTAGQEFVAFGSATRVLSPSAITMQDQTSIGSALVQAIRVNQATVFIARNGKDVYQHEFALYTQSYIAESLNSIAGHICNQTFIDWLKDKDLESLSYDPGTYKFTEMKWQQTGKVLWAVAGDSLVGLTLDPLVKCTGWHRHILGGTGTTDASGNILQPLVQSIAVIPEYGGGRDNLWVLVQRMINGHLQYMLEIIGPEYETPTLQAYSEGFGTHMTPVFMDCAYATFNAIPAASGTAAHLVGETVEVLVDGFYHPPVVVGAGGAVALNRTGNLVVMGLKYTPRVKLFPIEAGSAIGSAQGMMTKPDTMTVRFFNTLRAVLKGPEGTNEVVNFRPGNIGMGSAVPLFQGDKRIDVPMSPTRRCELEIFSDQPFPMTILGVIMNGKTYD